MELKQEARVLKTKALQSFIASAEAFNSLRDDARVTKVLLHLQHSFEMPLKAALVQAGKSVFDQATGRSVGFERCIGLAMADATINLAEADAGTLRAIDAMRDDEQHWFNVVSEQLLYLHVRAGVTLFDDLLQRVFGERLAGLFPERVLPVSADPPQDLILLVDDEYRQIQELLRPGRRARHEGMCPDPDPAGLWKPTSNPRLASPARTFARGREKGVRSGDPRDKVFPAPLRCCDLCRRPGDHRDRPLHQEGRRSGSLRSRRLDSRCRHTAD